MEESYVPPREAIFGWLIRGDLSPPRDIIEGQNWFDKRLNNGVSPPSIAELFAVK